MNEKGADASRVVGWIEGGILSGSYPVAAKDCASPTPAAAADNVAGMLDDEESAIVDKLAVHAENRAQCCFHLRGRIEWCLQSTHGKRNENLQNLDVFRSRKTYGKGLIHATQSSAMPSSFSPFSKSFI